MSAPMSTVKREIRLGLLNDITLELERLEGGLGLLIVDWEDREPAETAFIIEGLAASLARIKTLRAALREPQA